MQAHLGSKGLTTLFQQEGTAPLLSLQFWVQTGSIHESPQLGSGISHLLEHMVFKGTASYNGQELAERVSSLGGLWNAYTSTDRTVYHIDGPAKHWKEFLRILHELVFSPSFPRDEWEKERDVIRREMAMYDDDPQDIAYRTLNETLFCAHPRRLPVIGHRHLFDALSYEDMCSYHADCYTAEKTFIVCSSGADIIPQQAFIAEVEALQASVTPKQSRPYSPASESPQWGSRLTRREFAQPTSTLMLAWRTPITTHRDAAPLSILAHLLGSGRAAWLHQLFHDEEGIAHDVSCTIIPSREGEGAFVIEADCEREKRDELRDKIVEYMKDLPERDGFELGIQRSLAQLKTTRLRGLASVQGRANALGLSWHHSRNSKAMEEWEEALRQVTSEDIKRVIRSYFIANKQCEVSIDPLGSNTSEATLTEQGADSPALLQELNSGLRLITKQDKSIPIVSINLAVGAGCGTETAALAGINSLLSECMLKGTSTRSASDIADALENRGASISSDAGNNTLLISATCLKEDLSHTLSILADIILHPALDQKVIVTEKEAMIADVLDAEEDPLSLAFRQLRPLCFGDSSYGLIPDGTVESLRAISRDDLLHQHARLFCGRNIVLSLVGDVEDEVQNIVNAEFTSLPSGQPIERSATIPQQAGDSQLIADKEQAVLTLAIPSVPILSEKNTALALVLEWLRDMAGPIFTEIRENRGLAYYASASAMSGIDTGCFYFYLGTAPEQLAEARTALTECLARLAEEGIPLDAFERTRATALVGHQIHMQSHARIGKAVALDTLLGLSPEYSLSLPERLQACSHEEVSHELRELLHPDKVRSWVSVSNVF